MSNSGDGVAVEDVRRIAELSHLQLNPQEEAGMLRDLNAILGYVAQLNELDTSAIAPMAQVAEILDLEGVVEAHLREDKAGSCLERSSVMISAPDSDGIFFKVPKVIER